MAHNRWIQFIILATFLLGFVSGLLMDKGWFTDQEQAYIKKLTAENKLLTAEKQAWLTYIGEEMSDYDIVIPTQGEEFHYISTLLAQIGVEVKLLEESKVLEKEGILISLGNDKNIHEGLRQLSIDTVPIASQDIQQFYLSLLRMKGDRKDVGPS